MFHNQSLNRHVSRLRRNTWKRKLIGSISSVRFVLTATALSAGLIAVAGAGATGRLFGSAGLSKPAVGDTRTSRPARIPNFDIRLAGREAIDELLRVRSLSGTDDLISQTAIRNSSEIEAGIADLKRRRPDAAVEVSPLTGGVEIVRGTDGLTSLALGRTGEEIVREFISKNQKLYGLNNYEIADLNFIGESISPESGLRMVRVVQVLNGRTVFQSETRFILDKDGRVIRSLGLMVPNASETAEALDSILEPQEAFRRTMAGLGVELDAARISTVSSREKGFRTELRVDDPRIGGVVTSELVYFPAAPGVLVPAWSQIVFGIDEDWYVLVDAKSGVELWRKNIRNDASTHDARFRVYVQADGTTPADSPAPQSPSAAVPGAGTQFPGIAPTIVTMFTAQNLTASPNGWIDDCPGGVCGANQTQTLGNNALVCLDRDGTGNNVCDTSLNSMLDGNGRPTGNPDANLRNRDFLGTAPRDFQTNFLPPPQAGNPELGQTSTGNGSSGTLAIDQFRRASVTQQFYNANWYHDRLFMLGFNPAAGNFQNNNFGGGGVQNDRVLVDVQDASGTNNANFSTPPDGTSGRAQMYRFDGPTVDRDGGLDAEILFHELTHGTSNRLIGNGAGLQWDIGAGMGEGWSDFYALSLLNNTNADNPNSNYASGAYATYKAFGFTTFLDNYVYGIRRFPYSTNNSVNPLTWADADQTTYNHSGGIAVNPLGFEFGGALEVHNVGEIWANTLWEMRSRIIADPAGANGNVPTGNQTSLQLVTDALKMTPINPTFLQARDALIDADCATNACANEQSIWAAFADRGLGYGAFSPLSVQFGLQSGHIGLKESSNLPDLDINTVTVDDSTGNSSGFIDPNEPVWLNVNVKNPWRNASKTATGVSATISSSTPGVVILTSSAAYPNISPNSNADRISGVFTVKAPSAGVCGASMNFTVTITSSLGVVARNFTLRMGQPSGTLAPVTYTRSAVGLAIPDGTGSGAIDTMNIADDFQIADLNVRIDSLTHTWDGDVTAGIRGPNGYGTDLLTLTGWRQGGVTTNFGSSGDNFTNTVFDDEAVNDIISATTAQAPYTNSYRPAFNSPNWTPLIGATADATPQLSRFDGSSTLGQWKLVVSDWTTPDTGTLNGWSLIVTPQAFVCTAFVPTAAEVIVSGTVRDAAGRPLPRVILTLSGPSGETITARSNTFGNFTLTGVEVGQSYILSAQAKGFSFFPQFVMVQDQVIGLEVIAVP